VTDGWYEWAEDDNAQPYCIQQAGAELTVMAGLWEEWKDALTGERRRSCTMMMTTPNEQMAALPHHRMPVLLEEKEWPLWLGEVPGDLDEIGGMLRPYAGELKMWTIDRRVGSVKNNDPSIPLEVPPSPKPAPLKKPRAQKPKQGSLI